MEKPRHHLVRAFSLKALLPFALLLMQADGVHAGSIRALAQAHTSTTSNLDPNNPPNNVDSTGTLNTGYLAPTGSISDFRSSHADNDNGSQGDADYDLSVSVGTLRASVHTSGSAAADWVNYPDLFNVAGGNATALVEWSDELTVTGPVGRNVSVLATVVFSADGYLTPFTTGDTYNSADFRFLLPTMNFIDVTLDSLQGGHRYEQTFLLDLAPGRSYNLSASLGIEANAAARINDPNPLWKSLSTAGMDAGHTAQLFLEVMTPGGSYSLASGAVLTPVPEPSTALLVALGLVGLARSRRSAALTAARRSADRSSKIGM